MLLKVKTWRNRIEAALRVIENHRRREKGLPAHQDDVSIYLPKEDHLPSMLRLMNLQVWCLRYKINLEFILDTLLKKYDGVRRRNLTQRKGISLGIPITLLTGTSSRRWIETAVQRAYPMKENLRQQGSPLTIPLLHFTEVKSQRLSVVYDAAVRHRQKENSKQRSYRRNWRTKYGL